MITQFLNQRSNANIFTVEAAGTQYPEFLDLIKKRRFEIHTYCSW
jgi:hypothetical protein